MRKKSQTPNSTLKDIAEATGVSVITVSRAINTPEKVKPHTLELINEAIRTLNYVPNDVAKALVTKRSNIILLYIPQDLELVHPFTMHVIAGVSEILWTKGYSLRITRSWFENELCDGIILVGIDYEDTENLRLLSKKKKCIMFGSISDVDIDWVDIDNLSGSKKMSDYMIEAGYKNIAYIGIRQHRKFADDRAKGYLESLVGHNVAAKDINITGVPNTEADGYTAAKNLITNPMRTGANPPDAIICASDLLAMGAVRAIKELGLRIPEDIAVSGFDGLGYENFVHPNLTTVRQPVFEIGKLLAESLIEKIKTESDKRINIFVEPEIIKGESTF